MEEKDLITTKILILFKHIIKFINTDTDLTFKGYIAKVLYKVMHISENFKAVWWEQMKPSTPSLLLCFRLLLSRLTRHSPVEDLWCHQVHCLVICCLWGADSLFPSSPFSPSLQQCPSKSLCKDLHFCSLSPCNAF